MNNISLKLIIKELPITPVEEINLEIGLQDKKGEIQTGRKFGKLGVIFECEVKAFDNGDKLDFKGNFVHGKPKSRFIYIS